MQTAYETAYEDPKIDIIISLGAMSSGVMAGFKNYSKPSIASVILDNEIQQIPLTAEGTSGVENFTYIQSPFSMERDISSLHRLKPFQKLGIVGGSNLITYLPFLDQLVGNICMELGADFTIIPYTTSVETTLGKIPADVDAIYFLPVYDEMTEQELSQFFAAINEKGIPSAALLGKTIFR